MAPSTHDLAYPSVSLLVDETGAIVAAQGDARVLDGDPAPAAAGLGAVPAPLLWEALGAPGLATLLQLTLRRGRDGGRVELALEDGARRLAVRIERASAATCRVTVLRLQDAAPEHVLPPGGRGPCGPGSVTACSWCARVRGAHGWIELELAVRDAALFSSLAGAEVSHGICERCSASLDLP